MRPGRCLFIQSYFTLVPGGAFGLDGRGALFLRAVHALPAHGFVEIDLVAVEFGAFDAGETRPAADRHAQAPHMPVPSTISALSDTVVLSPYFFVVSATNFIMTMGPMATHSS